MPMPEGPPFTSLVTSVLSECPDNALIPRILAWANIGWSANPFSSRIVSNPSFPLLNPSASIERSPAFGSMPYFSSPVDKWVRCRASPKTIHKAYVTGALCPPANKNLSENGYLGLL